MGVKGRTIGESMIGMRGEARDDRSGERPSAHIGQGLGIDHIVAITGAQQLEEVATALRAGGAKPSEVGVADLSAEAVLDGVDGLSSTAS